MTPDEDYRISQALNSKTDQIAELKAELQKKENEIQAAYNLVENLKKALHDISYQANKFAENPWTISHESSNL